MLGHFRLQASDLYDRKAEHVIVFPLFVLPPSLLKALRRGIQRIRGKQ